MEFGDELEYLFLAARDVLVEKAEAYGDSWKKRGGIGAFMVMARKWDRIEHAAESFNYNIFDTIEASRHDVMEDITDLRNYLTLLEHEVRYGRQRKSDSDADFTTDSQESPGASAEELGVGDNGDTSGSLLAETVLVRELDKD